MASSLRATSQTTAPLILVADDEINTTIMIEHIFEREGYRVEKVNNGIAALEAAHTLNPDLILLDILMPGMNGFEVLRQLRDDPRTKSIPTIMITANARQPADVARGLNLGADDYVYKPFAHQELVARAESKLKARQLQDAVERRTQELEALLHISDTLAQHLEVHELLELVLKLTNERLPVDLALIYHFSESGEVHHIRIQPTDQLPHASAIHDTILSQIHEHTHPFVISNAEPILPGMQSFMGGLLRHSDQVIGALALFSRSHDYDEHQARLFTGIVRQAALALRNAQLYEVQLNYAQHLEEMVNERTEALKSAQQMLIQSEKLAMIGNMAASLAHEINTPLMPIKLTLEDFVLQLQDAGTQFDQGGVELIQENIERIQRIIRRLLDFARSTDPDSRELDVNGILDGIIKLNHKYFQHARVDVDAHLSNVPSIHGSKDQLEQVFMNLALNAQAAMPDGGKLTITSSADVNDVIITFKDTGIGIPPENVNRIFDPFFSTKPQGTGLGLFVSYGIIQAHQGKIEVKSKLNAGTEFTIRIPIFNPDRPL